MSNHHNCIENNKNIKDNYLPVVGEVTGTLTNLAAITPRQLPLTSILFATKKVDIPPTGGVVVKEDGEYFISFNATTVGSVSGGNAPFVTFSIYTPDFSGTALVGNSISGTTATSAATFGELVCLRKNDTVFVTVSSTLPLAIVTGVLTVIRVGL